MNDPMLQHWPMSPQAPRRVNQQGQMLPGSRLPQRQQPIKAPGASQPQTQTQMTSKKPSGEWLKWTPFIASGVAAGAGLAATYFDFL